MSHQELPSNCHIMYHYVKRQQAVFAVVARFCKHIKHFWVSCRKAHLFHRGRAQVQRQVQGQLCPPWGRRILCRPHAIPVAAPAWKIVAKNHPTVAAPGIPARCPCQCLQRASAFLFGKLKGQNFTAFKVAEAWKSWRPWMSKIRGWTACWHVNVCFLMLQNIFVAPRPLIGSHPMRLHPPGLPRYP